MTPQETLIYIANLMFSRRLTDMAGGNISMRVGNTVYLSPRYAGSKQHWQLRPDDIVSGPIDTNELFAHPRFSREGRAHLGLYRTFAENEVSGCIHAHPFHILPFCVAERPMEAVLESTRKFGTVEVVKGAPAHSQELADQIIATMLTKRDAIAKQAGAVILPRHGVFIAGKDIFHAIDALERLDWQAHALLSQGHFPQAPIGYQSLENRS
jgi:L-fuculose-phosphate aldolase